MDFIKLGFMNKLASILDPQTPEEAELAANKHMKGMVAGILPGGTIYGPFKAMYNAIKGNQEEAEAGLLYAGSALTSPLSAPANIMAMLARKRQAAEMRAQLNQAQPSGVAGTSGTTKAMGAAALGLFGLGGVASVIMARRRAKALRRLFEDVNLAAFS